ncbi:hypothetical protein [Methylobacterium sp. sgz302541]|uniref:hypothetical protein n=1 Tax=unclassified Methylobacterium TaxID=2615210 RepID=UPI003D3254F3
MTTVSALCGALLLIGLAAPASAASAPEERPVKMAEAARVDPALAPAQEADGEGYACNKARRRLWVEGEGWVVRRVTTCR